MAPSSKLSLMLAAGCLALWSAANVHCAGQQMSSTTQPGSAARSFDIDGGLSSFFGNLGGGISGIGASGGGAGAGHQGNSAGGSFAGFGPELADLFGGIGGKVESKKEALASLVQKKDKAKASLFDLKSPGEFLQLILNPIELINRIVVAFKLEKVEFLKLLSEKLVIGFEIALQPALISVKIIEKIFVPDACKLKFICELAKPIAILKGNGVPKFSPGFLDGASTFKAFVDGLTGCDCGQLYPCSDGLPKLKKEFLELKRNEPNHDAHRADSNYSSGDHDHDADQFASDREQYASASNQKPRSAAPAKQGPV